MWASSELTAEQIIERDNLQTITDTGAIEAMIDEVLAAQGVSPENFTDAGRNGVTKDGQLFGLPFDNWTMLFHVNLNLMKEAGLVNADGTPMLPTSAENIAAQ